MIIRRVEPLSCAGIVAAIYAALGFIIGAGFTLAALLGAFAVPRSGMPIMFGLGAVVLLPLVYGAFAFVLALVVSALYNVFASRLGGIEVDVQ